MKTCNKCELPKPLTEFPIRTDNGKHRNECKECKNKYDKEYLKINYKQIREKRIPYFREYYKENINEIKAYSKKVYESNKKDIQKKRHIIRKNRKHIDPLYKLKENLSQLVRKSFKTKGFKKNSRTEKILGCSYDEFIKHIESKFLPWMTWDNYGLYNSTLDYGWDIDHKVPLCSAADEADIVRLNHYTNLQPLCSRINRNIKNRYF